MPKPKVTELFRDQAAVWTHISQTPGSGSYTGPTQGTGGQSMATSMEWKGIDADVRRCEDQELARGGVDTTQDQGHLEVSRKEGIKRESELPL